MSMPAALRDEIEAAVRFRSGDWKTIQSTLLGRSVQEGAFAEIDRLAAGRIDGDYLATSGMRIESFFPGSEEERSQKGYFASFTLGNGEHNLEKFNRAHEAGLPVVLCEDGLLSCIATHNDESVPPEFRTSCSLTCDTRGFYFDATRETDIERLLNTREIAGAELEEARRLKDTIVRNRLSKYNSQPVTVAADLGCALREDEDCVLVVDQDYGDYSTLLGDAGERDFRDMLQSAVSENPGSRILVKTHPDALVDNPGARKGYFASIPQELLATGRIAKITVPANPYALMDRVSKVYVATSTLGFEALLAGKEVHCFGRPWYSGWGATADRKDTPRRKARRTVEELLYVFYFVYTRWCDIRTGFPCDIWTAVRNLIDLRAELEARRVRSVG